MRKINVFMLPFLVEEIEVDSLMFKRFDFNTTEILIFDQKQMMASLKLSITDEWWRLPALILLNSLLSYEDLLYCVIYSVP